MTIDCVGIKMKFDRNYLVPGATVIPSWTFMIGLATPSIKYFPFCWRALSIDKVPGDRVRFGFHRLELE